MRNLKEVIDGRSIMTVASTHTPLSLHFSFLIRRATEKKLKAARPAALRATTVTNRDAPPISGQTVT